MDVFEYKLAKLFVDFKKRVVKRVDKRATKVYSDNFLLKTKKYNEFLDKVFSEPEKFEKIFGKKYNIYVENYNESIEISYWTGGGGCDNVIKNVAGYEFAKADCDTLFYPDYVKRVGNYVVVYTRNKEMYVWKKGLMVEIQVFDASIEKVMDTNYMNKLIEKVEKLTNKPYVGILWESSNFNGQSDFVVKLKVKGRWLSRSPLLITGDEGRIDLITGEGFVTHVASIDNLDKIIEEPDEKIFKLKFPYKLKNVVNIYVDLSPNGGDLVTFVLDGCRKISFNTLSKKFRVTVDNKNYYYKFEKMKNAMKKAGCEVV